jgi:nitroreductase
VNEKPAETRKPIHDLLRRRWSPRAFSQQPVEPEALVSLLEAARWAASCFNDQPWFFLVATRSDAKAFDRMLGCLVESNQVWARRAPVLMISVTRLAFAKNGRPNRHAFHDVGAAAACLTIQAMALGLWVHQMAGIERDRVRELYQIPEGHEAVAGIAVGHAGDPVDLPEPLRQRELAPRERKALEEMVFTGSWGKAASFLSGSD